MTDFCNVNARWFPQFLIIVLGAVWGSSFILMKRGLEVFSPTQVAGIRLVLAGAVLLPWVLKYSVFKSRIDKKTGTKILQKKDYLWLAASGIIGSGVPAFLFSYAGQIIPSALSGILNAFTPMFTLLFGVILFKEKLDKLGLTGVVLGLFGAVFLFGPNLLNYGAPIPVLGALLPLSAALLYGLNINIIKRYLNHLPGMVKTAYPFVATALAYLPLLISSDTLSLWDEYPGPIHFDALSTINPHPRTANTAFFYVFLLGFFGSALSMLAFNYVIKKVPPLMASTTTFIIPITAVFWGFLDSESITWNTLVGLLFLLVAVYLIIRRKS